MIKTLEPSIKTHLVDQDAMVTMDHDINRVRVSDAQRRMLNAG